MENTLNANQRKFQSSPAINCGRHDSWAQETDLKIVVSILTRDQLRASLFCSLRTTRSDRGFNPHPRSTAGVTIAFSRCSWDMEFQSSPAINCGRHQSFLNSGAGRTSFNPHPRSTAGVTKRLREVQSFRVVSILTRDQLRASPCLRCQ